MSGLLRNFLTLLFAAFGYGKSGVQSRLASRFVITPFDAGVAVLKSDKYFQLAEAAQLDFVVRTGLIGTLLKQRTSFVNASQLVRFAKPVRMFSRVTVETEIAWWDDKCAWFSHRFLVGEVAHGQVWVKMKFKQGRRTVDPRSLIGPQDSAKPDALVQWDRALDSTPAANDSAPHTPRKPFIREPETP